MKVLVCFKEVPELDAMAETDWTVDGGLRVDTSFLKTAFNCFDESALELALKLADGGENLSLSALTIGDKRTERRLKTLYALKYGHVVRVDAGETDLRFRPLAVSRILAEYISVAGGQDVILLGRQSGEGDNGQAPLLLGERLGLPVITQVEDVRLGEGGLLTVTSLAGDMRLRQVVCPPVVLAVGNSATAYLRVPTLKDRMTYGKREVETLSLEKLGLSPDILAAEGDSSLTGLSRVDRSRAGIVLEGEDPEQLARTLYLDYLKGRLAQ